MQVRVKFGLAHLDTLKPQLVERLVPSALLDESVNQPGVLPKLISPVTNPFVDTDLSIDASAPLAGLLQYPTTAPPRSLRLP